MLCFLDAFSGIGGFALGARLAGIQIEHHFYSDIDAYANRIYAQHFPDAKPLGDIRHINGDALRRQYPEGDWIITGGFPCQDFSTAGKRRGLQGSQSSLWFELFRVICEIRPTFVVLENVRQICQGGLARVMLDLATIRYDAEWRVFRACEFGLPHRRERLFIVAYPHDPQRCGRLQQASPSMQHLGDREQGYHTPLAVSLGIDWRDAVARGEVLGQPAIFRVDDGLPAGMDMERMSLKRYRQDRERITTLGNAIVPQIAAEVFYRIKRTKLLNSSHQPAV